MMEENAIDNGRIDRPLDGRRAITEYRHLQYDAIKDQSSARVKILTGRRHQIRRHFESIGHPLMGDPRYGCRNKNQEGLQLVAYALTFECPFGKGKIDVAVTPDKMTHVR